MPMREEFITGAEFKRWMDEEAGFRERIERRMADGFSEVKAAVASVAALQREANGKTAAHAETIAVIKRDIEAIRSEDAEIERTVSSIREDGCSQYAAHVRVLQDNAMLADWSRKKKTAAAGGLIGLGALVWPALQEMAKAAHALLTWMASR